MHINYILNLGTYRKSYIASGSFELAGSAEAKVKYIYPAFGDFELIGDAIVVGPVLRYSGFGSFEIDGITTIKIPPKLYKDVKFDINQIGTTYDNKQYTVYQIQGVNGKPLYASTNSLTSELFNNNSLFTDSEIASILTTKYFDEKTKYENIIAYIDNKLNTVPLPVNNEFLTSVKFNLKETFVNLLNQNKQVISILGLEQNPEYVSNSQIADGVDALTNPENVEYTTTKNNNLIIAYENKLNVINNKISGMSPPVNVVVNTISKFYIKQNGFNNLNQSVNINSIIGSTSQIYYNSKEGIYEENQLLDDSEAATYFSQKYDNKLNKYIEKLAEINGRLNA